MKERNGQPGTPSCPVCGHDGPCAGCYERDQKIASLRREICIATAAIEMCEGITVQHCIDNAEVGTSDDLNAEARKIAVDRGWEGIFNE
ncbi:MAG: hypothetical protein PHX83_07100 [Acidobacteriia bacterium]|nr:hypothetical protein [Terriglobia bacterium]